MNGKQRACVYRLRDTEGTTQNRVQLEQLCYISFLSSFFCFWDPRTTTPPPHKQNRIIRRSFQRAYYCSKSEQQHAYHHALHLSQVAHGTQVLAVLCGHPDSPRLLGVAEAVTTTSHILPTFFRLKHQIILSNGLLCDAHKLHCCTARVLA